MKELAFIGGDSTNAKGLPQSFKGIDVPRFNRNAQPVSPSTRPSPLRGVLRRESAALRAQR
jgi:hypothetical protein